jgi:hypothetical protein
LRRAQNLAKSTTIGVGDMAAVYNRLSNNVEPMEDGVDCKYHDQTSKQFGPIDSQWTDREIALYQWAQQLELEVQRASDNACILSDAVNGYI